MNSPEATQYVNPVIRFYQAAFGRVPDKAGLTQQVSTLEVPGQSLKTIATGFTQSQEFINRYGSGTTVDTAFLQALYVNVLGRTGTATEIQNWLTAVATSGSGYSTRADVLFGFAQSVEFQADASAGTNSFLTAAAQGTATYSGSLPLSAGAGTTTQGLTAAVDNLTIGSNTNIVGQFSATAANQTVNVGDTISGTGTGNTLKLYGYGANGTADATTLKAISVSGVQNIGLFSPTAGADVSGFKGVTSVQIDSAANPQNTVTSGTTAAVAPAGLAFTVGANQAVTVSNFATVAASTTTGTFSSTNVSTANANALTINEASSTTNAALVFDGVGSSKTAATITLTGGALTSETITLQNTISGATNESIKLVGPSSITSAVLNGAAKATIDFTGETGLKTIDASATSGNDTFIVGTTGSGATINSLTSIIGGSGNDTFNFGGAAVGSTTVTGGSSGNNTIAVTGANAVTLTATTNTKVTNVQTLEITDAFTPSNTGTGATAAGATTAGTTIDLSKVTGLGNVTFDGTLTVAASVASASGTPIVQATNGQLSVLNLANNGTVTFKSDVIDVGTGNAGTPANQSASDLSFTVAGGQSNSSLNFVLAKYTDNTGAPTSIDHTINAFTAQNVSTATINVKDVLVDTNTAGAGSTNGAGGANAQHTVTFTGIADAQLTTLTLSSSAVDSNNAAVKAAAFTAGSGFTTNLLTTVDASGYNGAVDIHSLSGNLSAVGATIKGGSGLLWAVGGNGSDAITVGTGGGALDGGAGVDTFNLSATSTSTANITLGSTTTKVLDVVTFANGQSSIANPDSVTGFHLGATAATSDVLAFGGTISSGGSVFTAATSTSATSVAGNITSSSAGQSGGTQVSITNGIATVSGATGTASVTALANYLDTVGANATAAIVVGSDTYVVHSDGTTGTANDAVVKLVGISAANVLSTTAYGANTIHVS